MTDTTSRVLAVIGILGVIMLFVFGTHGPDNLPNTPAVTSFGAVGNLLAENYDPYVMYNQGYNSLKGMTIQGVFTSGATGTGFNGMNSGFCNVNAAATTITASSTAVISCGSGSNGATALTGVTAGDRCFLFQASTTPTTNGGLDINGVSASSTSGFLTAVVANNIGSTFTWSATASTSWQYYCNR